LVLKMFYYLKCNLSFSYKIFEYILQ